MPTCDVCGNDYDRAMEITIGDERHTFDSFECAIHAIAPRCAHCGCRDHRPRPPGRRRDAAVARIAPGTRGTRSWPTAPDGRLRRRRSGLRLGRHGGTRDAAGRVLPRSTHGLRPRVPRRLEHGAMTMLAGPRFDRRRLLRGSLVAGGLAATGATWRAGNAFAFVPARPALTHGVQSGDVTAAPASSGRAPTGRPDARRGQRHAARSGARA